MDLLTHKKYLIAIGGTKNTGKTQFSIQLANKISEREKVLYLNWVDYAEKLHKHIVNSQQKINKNLTINTNINYFDVGSFLHIIDLIESYDYTTVFIDDINHYIQSNSDYFDSIFEEQVINAFRYIVDKLSVRVFFTINIPSLNYITNLDNFTWSRSLVNECDEIYTIKSLNSEENQETGEIYGNNTFDIFRLKDKTCEEKHKIITL